MLFRDSMMRLAAVLVSISFAMPLWAATPLEFFETEVRPLMAEKCFACHTQTKMGGLAMTSRQALLEGGASGPAVEPKAPERSLPWDGRRVAPSDLDQSC